MPSGLRIARTVFGPTIHGKGATPIPTSGEITHGLSLIHEQEESDLLQNIFEPDSLGISQEECAKDGNAFEYLQSYTKSISFENGIVTVPFPLKDNILDLVDNYPVAHHRPLSLQKQLCNNAN